LSYVLIMVVISGAISMLPRQAFSQIAQDSKRSKIAVLHLHAGTEEINFKFATHLTDKVREVVREELTAKRYMHISKEQILKLELGWKDCEEGQDQCRLTLARQLRVDLVVTGEISRDEGGYLYALTLTRVRTGEELAVRVGDPVYKKGALGSALARTTSELIQVLAKGRLKINSIPTGAGVVLDRAGKEKCFTPCMLWVDPGDHLIDLVAEGYQRHSVRAAVEAEKTVVISGSLESVAGTEGASKAPLEVATKGGCEKPGFTPTQTQSIRRGGDCPQMSALLVEYKRCRKELKRSMRQAAQRCVETGEDSDCNAERLAKRIYDEEVASYRKLVTRMRQLSCPGTPR